MTIRDVEKFLDIYPDTGLSRIENMITLLRIRSEFSDRDLLPIGYTRDAVDGYMHKLNQLMTPEERQSFSAWSLLTYGNTFTNDEVGDTVTFKTGYGRSTGHTIISDGELSQKEFNNRHNHYGHFREKDGRIEDDGGDKGFYTGPLK